MRDPIDELESFDPGAPRNPLPPAEVRRLGERHRRRRTAGAALAAAAAVVVVAAGGAVLAGGETRSERDPVAPSPARTAEAPRLPDGLDLTVGMGEDERGKPVTAERGGLGLSVLDFCGTGSPFAEDGRADSLSAFAAGRRLEETREVVLYPDEAAAARVLDNLTDSALDCPRVESGPGAEHQTITTVSPWRAGQDGIVAVRTYTSSPGAEVVHLTRVGPALLAASTFSTYEAPGVVRRPTGLQDVVAALCAVTAPPADPSPTIAKCR
ncbi:hypothetical protein [Nocardioides sp. cx-173]|uniref:hypothetical protein n=1 Tax=Nocardioides sp. cx-173 TaxID=2898796 RepID=UPI001E54DEAE|nr:hypothetical protein [Nocardioides sp. cx-173]MCD4524594.1 hypothetical protein [Nocardioides sp. cx-173]UGB42923.1 hypothetical protein LQ940_05215 [Nocardioides sp. cx-173]